MNRFSRKFRWFARLASAAVAVGAVAWGTTARASDDMAVNIGYYPGAMFQSLLYIADEKGFYKAAGLKPTLIAASSGPMMNSQMGSGAIDLAFQPPSNVGVARERGLDQVYVMGNVAMPWVLVARKGLNLPNRGRYPEVVADMKGLNWGVYGRGSDSEMFMRVMAIDAKLAPEKDITWLAVGGPATGLPALKSGKIDVYLALDPAPVVASELGYGEVIIDLRKGEGPANFSGQFYQGVVTLRKTAEARPKVMEAMLKAHTMALCWARDERNFEDLLTLLRGKLPVSELSDAAFRQMVKTNLPTFTLSVPKSHFSVWNEMLLRGKALKEPIPDSVIWPGAPTAEPSC